MDVFPRNAEQHGTQGRREPSEEKASQHDESFTAENCRLAPRTCSALAARLPILQTLEDSRGKSLRRISIRAMFTVIKGRQPMGEHSGQAARINLQMCVSGCEGAELWLNGEVHKYVEGRAFAWQDGWRHEVVNRGAEERWVLMITLPHPALGEVLEAECAAEGEGGGGGEDGEEPSGDHAESPEEGKTLDDLRATSSLENFGRVVGGENVDDVEWKKTIFNGEKTRLQKHIEASRLLRQGGGVESGGTRCLSTLEVGEKLLTPLTPAETVAQLHVLQGQASTI